LLENAETDVTPEQANQAVRHWRECCEYPHIKIEANPFQPRTDFEQEALKSLLLPSRNKASFSLLPFASSATTATSSFQVSAV